MNEDEVQIPEGQRNSTLASLAGSLSGLGGQYYPLNYGLCRGAIVEEVVLERILYHRLNLWLYIRVEPFFCLALEL